MTGGGKKIAEELNIPFLGSILIDEKISDASDKGTPFTTEYPDSQHLKLSWKLWKRLRLI